MIPFAGLLSVEDYPVQAVVQACILPLMILSLVAMEATALAATILKHHLVRDGIPLVPAATQDSLALETAEETTHSVVASVEDLAEEISSNQRHAKEKSVRLE